MKKEIVMLGLAVAAFCASAAPAASAVAEGYADWKGLETKNLLKGHPLTPSDFRHRVTVFVVMSNDPKDETAKVLGDQLRLTGTLAACTSSPDWAFDWNTKEDMPRDILVVGIINGAPLPIQMKNAFANRENETGESNQSVRWRQCSLYTKVEMINGPEINEYPYVYVMGPSGTEPRWKGAYGKASYSAVRAAISAAKRDIKEWTPLTGVAEPEFFKKEKEELLSGKPAQPVLARLKKSIGDSNPEKAKEAQIMYDAILQHRSALVYRIKEELSSSPARAFVDMQRLVVLFPQEKKNLQSVSAKLKGNKSIGTIGKMFEKVLEWNRPDFTFKNASDAKKAVQLVNTWRKPLEKMSEDQSDAGLAGEASLILAQLDGLVELLPTKVPQK